MKHKATIILLLIFCKSFSQQIKVEYLFVVSPIANLTERLYIKDKNFISIQDSIVNVQDFNKEETSLVTENTKFSAQYVSRLSNSKTFREFQAFERSFNDRNVIFEVDDIIKNHTWEINYKESKKILKYECIKAETNFRGRKFTAYFAKDLNYDTGPFKFYGLPGLILEVYANDIPYYRWKAKFIDLDNKENIDFMGIYKNVNKINIKEFVDLMDRDLQKFSDNVDAGLPAGTISERSKERWSIEKIYEWE